MHLKPKEVQYTNVKSLNVHTSGMVHPKMSILLPFAVILTHFFFFSVTQKEMLWKWSVIYTAMFWK